MGSTRGFIINYTPDAAVQFDTEGQPMGQLAHAYAPGAVSFEAGGRAIDARGLEALLGVREP